MVAMIASESYFFLVMSKEMRWGLRFVTDLGDKDKGENLLLENRIRTHIRTQLSCCCDELRNDGMWKGAIWNAQHGGYQTQKWYSSPQIKLKFPETNPSLLSAFCLSMVGQIKDTNLVAQFIRRDCMGVTEEVLLVDCESEKFCKC